MQKKKSIHQKTHILIRILLVVVVFVMLGTTLLWAGTAVYKYYEKQGEAAQEETTNQ